VVPPLTSVVPKDVPSVHGAFLYTAPAYQINSHSDPCSSVGKGLQLSF